VQDAHSTGGTGERPMDGSTSHFAAFGEQLANARKQENTIKLTCSEAYIHRVSYFLVILNAALKY
jgi:hypothetical protein